MPKKSQLEYLLALIHIPGLGTAYAQMLAEFFPDLHELFAQKLSTLEKLGLPKKMAEEIVKPNWTAVDATLHWATEPSHNILDAADPFYPTLLKEVAKPPALLFVSGNPELLNSTQIAIVGSRNPTHAGAELAQSFAHNLALHGFTITSGLALGIDGASHSGTLAAQGKTIAVMGTGLNEIYPRRHNKLAESILAQGGALISEFPLNTSALKQNFPQRNRIISGLSRGVLVVEAALQSGSLITARYALEQNREVFAIPGSMHNPLARGCNTLIRQGAKLVETVDDILKEFPTFIHNQLKHAQRNSPCSEFGKINALDIAHQKLLKCIDFESTSIDTLIQRSNFPAAKIAGMLLNLELWGYITPIPGGYIKKSI